MIEKAAESSLPSELGVRSRSPKIDLPTKRRRKHGRGRRPRRDNRKSRYDADYTGDDERHNESLEAYYKEQRIVPEAELPTLLACLASPLPTSFRITTVGKFRDTIQMRLKGEMQELFRDVAATRMGDEQIKPPTQLAWYPDGLAWTVSAPRQMLRRDNVLSPFHKLLVQMNELGAINRQEAVSMIPPLMLAVQPGDHVIDMCAAPGSKTAQILDTISSRAGQHQTLTDNGLVIANDADIRRCWMLSHQLKRFGAPELMVTHHDAQFFPKIMQFDRVLCDVPCTGDGTLRKAPDIWRRWTSDLGIGIHRLQRQILERGIEILKPGGRLVYSTCSMNPVENEAVVAHALRKYGDQIELIDVSDMLPELKRRAGLTTWKVKDNSTNVPRAAVEGEGEEGEAGEAQKLSDGTTRPVGWFTEFEQVPERRRKKIVRSLFPPSDTELGSGGFPLQRCLRLVPHDQDTGAFFVSVMVKRERTQAEQEVEVALRARKAEGARAWADSQLAAEPTEGEGEEDAEEGDVGTKAVRRMGGKAGRAGTRLITDDPLIGLEKLNDGMLVKLAEFLGLDVTECRECLMTRGADASAFKRVVVVSNVVRSLLASSLGSREGGAPAGGGKVQLRVVNAGVRVLERTDRRDAVVKFRIIHDGVHLLRRCMRKRILQVGRADFERVLRCGTVRLHEWESREFREMVDGIESGSALLVLGGEKRDGKEEEEEVVIVWKGRNCVSSVMPREQLEAMRQRFGVEEVGDGKEDAKGVAKGEEEEEGNGEAKEEVKEEANEDAVEVEEVKEEAKEE